MRKLFIAAVLGLFALLAAPLSASADHGNRNTEGLDHVQQSYVANECGVASVTLIVPNGTPDEWNYQLEIEVDGEVTGQTEVVQGPGESTFELTLNEDAGDGEVGVRYYFVAATEWDLVDPELSRQSIWPAIGDAFVAFTVNTDCEPDPTTEPTADPTQEPTSDPTQEPTAEPTETKAPVAVPTSVPAGLDELPQRGDPIWPWIVGIGVLVAVAGALVFNRVTSDR